MPRVQLGHARPAPARASGATCASSLPGTRRRAGLVRIPPGPPSVRTRRRSYATSCRTPPATRPAGGPSPAPDARTTRRISAVRRPALACPGARSAASSRAVAWRGCSGAARRHVCACATHIPDLPTTQDCRVCRVAARAWHLWRGIGLYRWRDGAHLTRDLCRGHVGERTALGCLPSGAWGG